MTLSKFDVRPNGKQLYVDGLETLAVSFLHFNFIEKLWNHQLRRAALCTASLSLCEIAFLFLLPGAAAAKTDSE